ncbi:MAG: hypothetical protein ABEH43_03110, partial [Flavobacteriales bacterium]
IGGPTDVSSIVGAGDMRFKNKPQVNLAKEVLNINIKGAYCHVDVVYTLKNKSSKSVPVEYGFPVDYLTDGSFKEWKDDYVKDIEFMLNDKKLKVKKHSDSSVYKDKIMTPYSNKKKEVDINRKWFLTNFTIKSDKTIKLRVKYKYKARYSNSYTNKQFFEQHGKKQLYYDFSPAHYWGNGKVDEFTVNIEAPDHVIKKMNVNGLPFSDTLSYENNKLHYHKENFDLKGSNPLYIEYDNTSQALANAIENKRVPKSKIKSIKASSTLKNYKAENIYDGNFKTAWVEGKKGGGIGEWVEIELKEKMNIGMVLIINGYTKSKSIYEKNNKVKKIKISGVESNRTKSHTLSDKEFIPLNNNLLYTFSDKITLTTPGSISIVDKFKKIRFEIKDIYEGTKYNDTCISEIYLLGY